MTALDDFKRLSGKLFVDGNWVASASTLAIDVIEPATEERWAISPTPPTPRSIGRSRLRTSRAGVVRPGPGAAVPCCCDIAAVIRRDKALYAECLTREEGKPFGRIGRRGIVVRDGHRLITRNSRVMRRAHRRSDDGAGPVPLQRQGTAGNHRHRASQLSAGPALLGSGPPWLRVMPSSSGRMSRPA